MNSPRNLMPQSATLDQYAEQARVEIDRALGECLQLESGCPVELAKAMRYSLLAPGKRLRPLLAIMAAEACGGLRESAMPAACAVEMIHAYSLIHDDLPAMDDDDLRRGQPTCHKKFDEATAILAGDALQALAFQVVAEQVKPPQTAAKCVAALAKAAGPLCMVGGQADDVAESHRPNSIEGLESIHDRKTGAMIVVSLKLGALVADATMEQIAALDCYGRALGLAFQVTDDLLDVCGEEATMGKRLHKDSEAGKVTFPGLLGVEQSVRRAEQLTQEACDAVSLFGSRANHLQDIAQYVLARNR